jgi:HK97 family phage major capsid protein
MSEVAPITAETFAAADVYKLQNALPPRFQARAQWCANIAILNQIAQHETTNGARLFPELGEGSCCESP